MGYRILLYVPNLIGYLRLILFGISLLFYSVPHWFLPLYSISVILDGVDGYCARRLNQMSRFGAWFDVVVDLISRGGLWCMLYKYGYFVIVTEWMTFVATHTRGPNWKKCEDDFPLLCRLVMAKGFKTPLGTFAIAGVHCLPIALYCHQAEFLSLYIPLYIQYLMIGFLCIGRILALRVEIFFIQSHIHDLLMEDNND